MNKLAYLLIVVGLVAIGFQQYRVESISKDLGKTNEQLKTANLKYDALADKINIIDAKRAKLEDKLSDLNRVKRETHAELDKKKGKESVIEQRPDLIEKKLNDSFKEAADRLSCSTGATERCVK